MKGEVRSEKCEDGRRLICFAMPEEAGPFKKLAGNRADVSILVTGIGKKNSERAVSDFLQTTTPQFVLTCGLAGGLNPDFKLGDVLFETDDAGLRAKISGAGASAGKFFCSDKIATTVAEKKTLRERTGADAVEMESDIIRAICRERGIPCATVRVISDTAHEDLPLDFNKLSKPDQSLDFGKLALAIVKSPGKIPALLKLQKTTRFAATRLAEVLDKLA